MSMSRDVAAVYWGKGNGARAGEDGVNYICERNEGHKGRWIEIYKFSRLSRRISSQCVNEIIYRETRND